VSLPGIRIQRPAIDGAGEVTVAVDGAVESLPPGATVARFDANGKLVFAERFATGSIESIGVSPSGRLFVGGAGRTEVQLGPTATPVPPGAGFVASIPPPH
jgi:hypothetical protein